MFQTKYLVLLKYPFVKKLRKKHRDDYLSEATVDDSVIPVGSAEDYRKLRNYYYSLLKLMDMIHYNCSVTRSVYESVFDLPQHCLVAITHTTRFVILYITANCTMTKHGYLRANREKIMGSKYKPYFSIFCCL